MNTPRQRRQFAFSARRLPLFSALLVGAALLPACVSQRMGTEVPRDAMIVGGGKVIQYEAVADGILFLVDQRDLIASQTIAAGEVYEVNGSVELANGTTVDLVESRLYFLPHDEMSFEEEEEELEVHDDDDHADLQEALDAYEESVEK